MDVLHNLHDIRMYDYQVDLYNLYLLRTLQVVSIH